MVQPSRPGYGIDALLIGRISEGYGKAPVPDSGITVSAIPWGDAADGRVPAAFALWSTSMPNPVLHVADPAEVLSPDEVIQWVSDVPIRHMDIDEKIADMRRRYWRFWRLRRVLRNLRSR